MNLGNNIRTIRIEKGFSQETVSLISGVERTQLSKIESGLVDPQFSTVKKIADALEVNISDFVKDKDLETKPFVKWAGGKTQLLATLMSLIPENFNNYYEPFVGGGALLFKLKPRHPHINDMNKELLSAYRCFTSKESYEELMRKIDEYVSHHSEENYLKVRALDQNSDWLNTSNESDRASRMIYLNKSCFNGLYRVNSKGYFNVPSGKKKIVNAYSKENFDNIYQYFKESQPVITSGDFEEAVKGAKKGDFIYFDPPYDTWEDKDSFTSYDKEGFNKEDQKRLCKTFKDLSKKGAYVMLSNHNTAFIRDLYKEFNIHIVNAKRMINSKADGRGDVEEVVITNY